MGRNKEKLGTYNVAKILWKSDNISLFKFFKICNPNIIFIANTNISNHYF